MIEKISERKRVFRDDLYPFLGGGNKGRKLVEIAKDIFHRNCNAIVTTGGYQSNHCRAVAVFAAQNKMDCVLVLHGPQEEFRRQSGNAKIMRLSGSHIVFVNNEKEIGPAMEAAMSKYIKMKMNPYYLWGGGHTMEGGLAYIKAVKELKEYCVINNWFPEYIFLASGTGSTQAGILSGLDKCQLDTQVIGISVGRQQEKAEKIVLNFYKDLNKKYGISTTNQKVNVLDNYLCGGYGKYNTDIMELSLNSLKNYGFTLDTCYTAKAFYGMKDYIKRHNLDKRNILFWHTGGIFNFLAE